jgi:DNA-binding transcriptional MerR regulator/heme/copper-type cytochrome/quinol oxidase subunit 2
VDIRGRDFRDYSNEDIKDLNTVAVLRKADFSISDISTMREKPRDIKRIVLAQIKQLEEKHRSSGEISKKLKEADPDELKDVCFLAEMISEQTKNVSLPAADIELSFYKFDGLTKDGLRNEVQNYKNRLREKTDKRIKYANVLFAVVILFLIGLGIYSIVSFRSFSYMFAQIRNYFGYSYFMMLSVMLYLLLLCLAIGAYYLFIKHIRASNDPEKAKPHLRILVISIAIFCVIVLSGFFVQSKISESLRTAELNTSENIVSQWYPILRMTDFADRYFQYPELYSDLKGFGLYINQACYNYPVPDILSTDMSKLLVWSYDICFKEIVNESDIAKEAASIVLDLNQEIYEISRLILDMQNKERASLVFPHSMKAAVIRERISDLAVRYIEKTEAMFK